MPVFVIPAFAQTSDTVIFVKHILRDSDGNLVASFEVTKIGYIEPTSLKKFLDAESTQNDPVMMIENQKIQIIERKGTLNFDTENVVSDTTLNTPLESGQLVTLIRLVHDGIPVIPGDELITIWTFIRPVN
jgi:hypothetical protein